MSRVSYFQRFSQKENHATNNTLLIFRYFYQASPDKLQRLLNAVLDTELSVGLTFSQQIKGSESVPDALILQEPLRLYVETKRGRLLDPQQIHRHVGSIGGGHADAEHNILLGLTKEPISQALIVELRGIAKAHGIHFAATTFSQIVSALRAQCEPFERELIDVIDDYEAYLAEERLLAFSNQYLAIVPCGLSFDENRDFRLYYQSPTKGMKTSAFLGIYRDRQVPLVGRVSTVVVCSYENGNVKDEPAEIGALTADQRERITGVVEQTNYYDLKQPHRFYLLDDMAGSTLRKSSPGGAMHRYLDLSQIIGPTLDVSRDYSAVELAALLDGRTFA